MPDPTNMRPSLALMDSLSHFRPQNVSTMTPGEVHTPSSNKSKHKRKAPHSLATTSSSWAFINVQYTYTLEKKHLYLIQP